MRGASKRSAPSSDSRSFVRTPLENKASSVLQNKHSKISTNRQEQSMNLQHAYKTLGQVIFESGLAEIFDLTPQDLTHPQNPKLQKFIGFCFQAGQETSFSPLNQKKFKVEGERHLGRFM